MKECSDARSLGLNNEQNVVVMMMESEFEGGVAFTTNKLLLLIDTLELR